MLLRLHVRGFKNLRDVEIHFGPFTCIAGKNGVGKSNLFDAIRFLAALGDNTIAGAAASVRGYRGIASLFSAFQGTTPDRMEFEADLFVPSSCTDDFGGEASPTSRLLRYRVVLAFESGRIRLIKEELTSILKRDAKSLFQFEQGSDSRWYDAAVASRKRSSSQYISTDTGKDEVSLHQDGTVGRAVRRAAGKLERTLVSGQNSTEYPTVLAVRRELQSWVQLQLEPTALRKPDEMNSSRSLASNGEHMPATLDRLTKGKASEQVFSRVANRLSELVGDIRSVSIDHDEKREVLTIMARMRDGASYPASALSDGTLRFLALTILEEDPEAHGLICLEEPENGIHPEKIPPMISLLRDIASDVTHPPGEDFPIRQVIFSTHSPLVAAQVPTADLLWARTVLGTSGKPEVEIRALEESWRVKRKQAPALAFGEVLQYLKAYDKETDPGWLRLIDLHDVQYQLGFES